MVALYVDTFMVGYTSGSVVGQDYVYRNRQRLQPYPLVQNESGYGSTMRISWSPYQVLLSPSLLTFANYVKCSELHINDSNFAPHTAVESYESGECSISMRWNCSRTSAMISWEMRELTRTQSGIVSMRKASASVSLYAVHQYSSSLQSPSQRRQPSAADNDGERKPRFFILWAPNSLCRRVLGNEVSFATLEVVQNAAYRGIIV